MIKLQLSRFGDVLLIDTTHENSGLIPAPPNYKAVKIGTHETCGHTIEVRAISNSHHALVCNQCVLRVPFPADLGSISALKKHFQRQFSGE